jgi:uncharacterized membrane protein (UPF0182 family)
VEPLYVKATGASTPILERVIVYYSNPVGGTGTQIGYGDTLAHALTNLSQTSIGLGISQGLNGGTTTPTTTPASPTPTTTAPGTTAPSTTAPATPVPTGTLTVAQIVVQLDAAAKRLDTAYKTGDPLKIAQAQADLKKYSDLYLKARSGPTPTKTR